MENHRHKGETMKLKIINIQKRFSLFGFYPYKVILVDLDTNIYYSDVMDELGFCKNFKPTYRVKNS